MAQKKRTSQTSRTAKQGNQTRTRGAQQNGPGRIVAIIVCIAVAVFFVASFYLDSAGAAGRGISGFFFGVFGRPGYLVPLIFIIIVIFAFLRNKPERTGRNFALSSLIYFAMIMLIAGFDLKKPSSPLSGAHFSDVYKASAQGDAGGIIGMYVDTGLTKVFGLVGMFLIASVLFLSVSIILVYPYAAPHFALYAEKRRERPPKPPKPPKSVLNKKNSLMDTLAEGGGTDEYDAVARVVPQPPSPSFFGRRRAKEPLLTPKQEKILSAVSDDSILRGRSRDRVVPSQKTGLNPDGIMTGYGVDPVRVSPPGTGLGDDYNGNLSEVLGKKIDEEIAESADVMPEDVFDEENSDPFDFSDIEGESSAKVTAAGAATVSAAKKTAKPVKKAPMFSDDDALLHYKLPSVDLLNKGKRSAGSQNAADIKYRAAKLEQTLKDFRVEATVVNVTVGPTVTRYEVEPDTGVKIQSIKSLEPDLALKLEVDSVRVVPMPGKAVIGIEASNTSTTLVTLREIVDSPEFRMADSKISFVLGKDISGTRIIEDLAEMPHLLIAGTTGSGKSVCVNSILLSILFRARPDEVKFIMIDPKIVELRSYNDIPHLLLPVVSEPERAATALGYAVSLMEERYRKFAETHVSSLKDYNEKVQHSTEDEKYPQIVIVIDELSDLMLIAPAKVQEYINRLAAKARAAGIHLIVATQQPLASILTSVIKANIPSRIAFSVASNSASRVILDEPGAERLLGKGDMLFKSVSMREPARIQGSFVNMSEVKRVTDFIRKQMDPDYSPDIMDVVINSDSADKLTEDEDEFFRDAVEMVVAAKQASISMIQRRFRIGYNRAARLVDMMEERGIVAGSDGTNKPRKVIMSNEQLMAFLGEADVVAGENASHDSEAELLPEDDMPPFDMDDYDERESTAKSDYFEDDV